MPNLEEEQLRSLQAELAAAKAHITELQNTRAIDNAHNIRDQSNNAPTEQPIGQVISAIYRQPKIPSFCRDNPVAWFVSAEISLRNAGITVSSTKADCIAEKLDLDALQAIQDLITLMPRSADIYDQVKARLIATFGSSSEARLRQLIKGQVPAIGKPSLILSRLRALDTKCGDDVLRTVFLDQIPTPCRAAIAISGITDLAKIAEMADKYMEVADSSVSAVAAASVHALSLESLRDELSRLSSQVKDIQVQFNKSKQQRGRSQI